MSRAEAAPLTGRTLGDFTVKEKLGEGGHGVVYRAEQRVLGREAVVKVLRARHADERVVARFLREAQLASRLDHPYAAHVYAFGAEPDGVLWIAMELVRGTPLSKLLAAQPGARIPLARWVGLLDRICEVVHTAHEQGIVHRDLKPDNIMVLSRAGRLLPKLLDLGVATRVVDPDPDDADGGVVGTPSYMAPEQWAHGEIDARTDVYALGVITYEALVGRVPFGGASVAEIARAHVRADVPPVADVPTAVGDAIRAALAKDRAARPATALAFAESVRAAAGLRVAAEALPRLDDGLRADVAWLPQPLVEAIGTIEAARNPHQARDALWQIVHVAARWLGVVALAARSRSGPGPGLAADAPAVVDLVRALPRRELTDEEWLELVRALARPFAAARDAYPIPELVDVALAEPSPFAPLFALRASELTSSGSEESLRDWLARTLPIVTPLVRALGFLTDYQLVVPREGGAEVWMGARKPRRPMIHVDGAVRAGEPALVDLDGRPVLALAPLMRIAAPAPGAAEELFVFAGPARARGRGARLVAEPHGFERHEDGVWDWFRDHLLAVDDLVAAKVEEAAPYRGLAAFTEKDAELFFGRERQAEAFANQLLVSPLQAVVGPSGAGKSSFVQAGVLPLLPPAWRAIVMRPGAAPIAAYEARVDLRAINAAAGETLVIVIDQFEELFTLCGDAAERERFARILVEAAANERVRVVLTLRDDFLVRAGELPALRDRLAQGLVLLATPAPDDLLRIVSEPARRAGYDFDDKDLPMRMVRAVAGQPGALALLSFTAAQLWELRDRHFKRLTRSAYDAIGGVEGALAAHADATLAACTADEQRLVRDAFRHLVTAEGTRAVLTRSELDDILGHAAQAKPVIERLVRSRLLVASEDDHVEIIHEALITAWPRLVQWRRDDAEGARLRDQLRAAARQWADRGRARGLLWRDDALDDYRRWRTRWPGALPELDEAFAAASLRDAARGRRLRRTLALTAATILVGATIALSLLYRSSTQNARESHDRLVASYVEQGRRLLLDGDYLRALPYLSAAYSAGDDSLAVRFMLHRAMKLADTPVFPGSLAGAAFRGDDRLVAIEADGGATIWQITTHRVISHLPPPPRGHLRAPLLGAVALDGSRAAVASVDEVVVWDGRITRHIPVRAAERLAFADDSARISIVAGRELSVWSTSDAHEILRASLPARAFQVAWFHDAIVVIAADGGAYLERDGDVTRIADGRRFVGGASDTFGLISDGGVELFDRSGRRTTHFAVSDAVNAALAPSGSLVAISEENGVIELFDHATGQRTGILAGHRAQARLAFAPDGRRLVSGGEDQTVRVWDVVAHGELVQYVGTGTSVEVPRFDASGRRVIVDSTGGVRIVQIDDPSAERIVDVGQPIATGGFAATGSKLYMSSMNGAGVWDAASGTRLAWLPVTDAFIQHLDAEARRDVVAVGAGDAAAVRDVQTGGTLATLDASAPMFVASFDHSGRSIATAARSGEIDLWDSRGRLLRTLHGHDGLVFDVEFSGDDRYLISAGYADRSVRLWDVETGAQIGQVNADEGFFSASFDGPGRYFVTATDGRTMQVWNASTLVAVRAFALPTSARAAAIDPAARLAVGVTRDGLVSVWDVESGAELTRFRHASMATSADFSGDRLLTTGADGRAIVWDVGAEVPAPPAVERFVGCRSSYQLRGTSLEDAPSRACDLP